MVVGGKEAEIRQFPWQVSLQLADVTHHFCGGAIIDASTILTAAHCLASSITSRPIQVRAGSNHRNEGGQLVRATKAIPHPKFGVPSFANNDVGILKLATPLEFNENVQPIGLASSNFQVHGGQHVQVSGWGSLIESIFPVAPERLQWVTIPVVDWRECKRIIDETEWDDQEAEAPEITEAMFCAGEGGKGSCQVLIEFFGFATDMVIK